MICVLGNFVVDLTGRSAHLPVAGETVIGSFFKMGPGGKGANQAVAAKRAGADVTLITRIGQDVFGEFAKENFRKEGLDSELIFEDPSTETGAALIMVDDESQNKILVVPGACAGFTQEELDRAEAAIAKASYFLTQLETNLLAIEQGITMAHEHGVPVVLNTAPIQEIPAGLLAKVTLVTPNEIEAEILTGVKVDTLEDCHRAADWFFDQGVRQVVITLGGRGVYANDGTDSLLLPVHPVKAVDTTGAGDAFNGAMVAALAEGRPFFEAIRFANVAAGLAVTRFGTAPAMAYREEILEAFS